MNIIVNAAALAELAHNGQVDKAGKAYIHHPMRVSCRVMIQGGSEEAIAAAWLHDVVEDTVLTLDDLREHGYPETVVEAVDALTHREGEDRTDYYARVAANPIALQVKRADIEDNLHPERLAALDARTRARLERKYFQALDYFGTGQ